MATDESTSERVERAIFVRSLFGRAEVSAAVERVGSMMRSVTFQPATTIYRRGEASEYLYFIVEGSVVLEAPGEPPWTFGPRDGFGFLDAMQDRPHVRTARASTAVRALAFSAEDWMDVLEDHGELGRGAILAHAEAVRGKIAQLSPDGGFAPVDPSIVLTDLGSEVGLVERIVLLSEARAFERAGIQALATLARVARLRRLSPGEVLLDLGVRPEGMYLVGSGVVEMTRQRPALTARFGAGSLAGGLSLLGLESSDVVLRAESEATVMCVSEDELFDVQEDHFDLARALFAYMANERSGFMRALSLRTGTREATLADGAGPPAEGLVS